jgi:hypothetical protein
MNSDAMIQFLRKFPIVMLLRLEHTLNGFYRAGFLSALLSLPFHTKMSRDRMSLQEIAADLETNPEEPGLAAWLDFGRVGTALMQRFCEEVDKCSAKAYLETDLAENVPFYNLT